MPCAPRSSRLLTTGSPTPPRVLSPAPPTPLCLVNFYSSFRTHFQACPGVGLAPRPQGAAVSHGTHPGGRHPGFSSSQGWGDPGPQAPGLCSPESPTPKHSTRHTAGRQEAGGQRLRLGAVKLRDVCPVTGPVGLQPPLPRGPSCPRAGGAAAPETEAGPLAFTL